jgi:hypothetical protein
MEKIRKVIGFRCRSPSSEHELRLTTCWASCVPESYLEHSARELHIVLNIWAQFTRRQMPSFILGVNYVGGKPTRNNSVITLWLCGTEAKLGNCKVWEFTFNYMLEKDTWHALESHFKCCATSDITTLMLWGRSIHYWYRWYVSLYAYRYVT